MGVKQRTVITIVTVLAVVMGLTVIWIFLPSAAKEDTSEESKKSRASSENQASHRAVSISSAEWTQVNGPFGGYITDMQESGSSIIAGTSFTYELGGNGIYRISNKGLDWKSLGGTDKSIRDLAVNPNNANDILFIAQGLFLTNNGGKAWQETDLKVDQYTAVAISPANAALYFAGTTSAGSSGLFTSTDRGKSWLKSSVLPETQWSVKPIWAGIPEEARNWIQAIEPHPTQENILFVGTNSALFKSTDKGSTWKRADDTFHRSDILDIKFNPTNPDEVFVRVGVFEDETCNGLAGRRDQPAALQSERDNCAGVYRSTDLGETWQQMDTSYFDPSEGGIFLDDSNSKNAYVIFSRLIERTSNGGDSWAKFFWTHDEPPIPNVGLERLIVGEQSDQLFIGGRQGLWYSDDGGEHWEERNKGFIGSEVVDIIIAADGTMYAGTYSMGTFRSEDRGQNWSFASYNLENPYVMLMAKQLKTNGKIFLTTNGGVYASADKAKTWRLVGQKYFFGKEGILPGIAHFHGIAVDPSDPQRIYVGGGGDQYSPDGAGMSISDDGGRSWHAANDGFETNVHVSKIVIDGKDPAIVYATTQGPTEFQDKTGSGHGVFKSTDYGRKWTKINGGLESVEINTLTIDPNNSEVLYVGTDDHGVYKSVNGGKSWQALAITGLPEGYGVGDIVIDPRDSDNIYVGTVDYFRLAVSRGLVGDHGVYASKDGGKTWSDYNQGLKHKGAFSLEMDTDRDVLYVGTRGGGIYWRKLQ